MDKDKEHILKVLRGLVDDLGKTVVIVMHDIKFASVYSDKIVILKDGKIVKDDITDAIISKDVLEDVYEIDFHIKNINGNNICVYF